MKTGYWVLVGALVIGLAGCASPGYESSDASSGKNSISSNGAPLHTAARESGANRSVIHTATMGVNVDDIKVAETKMRQVVADTGGYIVHLESERLSGQEPTLGLTLRVPDAQFDSAMTRLEGLGLAIYKTISANDVTEQILDAEARLKQLSKEREALNKKGNDFSADMMKDQLQKLTTQRNDLANKASMSTIELSLMQKPNAAMSAANASWGSDTWNAAVSSAVGAFRVVGSILIWLFVYSPLWGIAAFGLVWARKASRRRVTGVPAR